MDTVITVDNLCKKYVLRHERREKYAALRDVLAEKARNIGSLLKGRRSRLNNFSPSEVFWALRNVSFEVNQGDRIGIIGRNGAGKSTMLKILSRIVEPTSGKIKINGRIASLLEVGTGFHPELTGKENIFLNGAILGMSRAEIRNKFDAIVDFAEIEKFLDTPVKRYSSGMYVRLAFAVAAHLEPEILLVDEVLAVGDAQFQRKCLGKMEEVSKEGRTLLFVSHNMAAIRSLCSRAVLLTKGEHTVYQNVNECIDHYLSSDDSKSTNEINTTSIPRPSSGVDATEGLRIVNIKLDFPEGTGTFKTGRPMSVAIDFTVNELLPKVNIGFVVYSSENARLFDCRSFDANHSGIDLAPGRYRALATVRNNPLNPGLYFLSFGARCESKLLDYLPDVLSIRVETDEQFSSLWLEAPSGAFRIMSHWIIEPFIQG
jgi:lipopolysaccharide transport system ATP-binding protein